MSHYAQIIKKLDVMHMSGNAALCLEVGTEIRSVKLEDGRYTFKCRLYGVPHDGPWFEVYTDEDLPAFTDKGSAHRARQVHATLRRGRPLTGEEHVTKPIAFRPTLEQREWMQKHADKKSITISELVRLGLFKLGMPR